MLQFKESDGKEEIQAPSYFVSLFLFFLTSTNKMCVFKQTDCCLKALVLLIGDLSQIEVCVFGAGTKISTYPLFL